MSSRPSIPALLVLALTAFAQVPKPKFEVASIKLNVNNGPVDFEPRRSGDHVIMHNAQVGFAFTYAYKISGWAWQVVGDVRLPDGWNWYDFEAEAPASTSDADLRLMFQSLLEDRFKVKVHRETREVPAWNLVVAKGGSKLKPANPDSVIGAEGRSIAAGRNMIGMFKDGRHLLGKGVSVDQLADSLAGALGGPVHNQTALSGMFDYNVVFVPDDATDISTAPTLSVAIQRELGLKLEAIKEPAEVVVVDHIEKPTPN